MSQDVAYEGLTDMQCRAVPLILLGWTDVRIAEEIGIERNTLRRWRSDAVFAGVLDDERHAAREANRARLAALVEEAVDTLAETMRDPDASHADKLRAAGMVLDRVTGLGKTSTTVLEGGERALRHQVDPASLVDAMSALSGEELARLAGDTGDE